MQAAAEAAELRAQRKAWNRRARMDISLKLATLYQQVALATTLERFLGSLKVKAPTLVSQAAAVADVDDLEDPARSTPSTAPVCRPAAKAKPRNSMHDPDQHHLFENQADGVTIAGRAELAKGPVGVWANSLTMEGLTTYDETRPPSPKLATPSAKLLPAESSR